MQISNFSFPLLLCMSLLATTVMAEAIAIPDREHRKSMSYEEYSKYREKMREQVSKIEAENSGQNPAVSSSPSDQAENSNRDSTYGKGYHSRNAPADRPDIDARNRQDRPPHPERFNRGDVGRR